VTETQKTAVISAWPTSAALPGPSRKTAASRLASRHHLSKRGLEQEAKDLINDLPGASGFMCDVSSDEQIAKLSTS